MRALASVAILALCLAFIASARGIEAVQSSPPLAQGDRAPELTGTGKLGRLKDHEGTALVVYFASSATRDSKLALTSLGESLVRAKDLDDALLLIVVPSEADTELLAEQLAALPLKTYTVVSSDREDMRAYGVVAYPTAFVLDKQHEITTIVRGYGTLSSYRVVEALRFAAGALSKSDYLRELGANDSQPVAKPDRYVRMAEKLIGEGRTKLALDALLAHLDENSNVRHVALAARLAILLGDEANADSSMARLHQMEGTTGELALLEIERGIRLGKLDAAKRSLEDLATTHTARTIYLQALLSEARGDAEESARRFKEAAERFAILSVPANTP